MFGEGKSKVGGGVTAGNRLACVQGQTPILVFIPSTTAFLAAQEDKSA